MEKLVKTTPAAIVLHGKLKAVEPGEFKTMISSMIIKLRIRNGDPELPADVLEMWTTDLYAHLRSTWPGVTPFQVWRTLSDGCAKAGDRLFRVTYNALENYVTYHRYMKSQDTHMQQQLAPTINEQAGFIASGLARYRKAVANGEYTPKGRADDEG